MRPSTAHGPAAVDLVSSWFNGPIRNLGTLTTKATQDFINFHLHTPVKKLLLLLKKIKKLLIIDFLFRYR